MSAFSSSSSSSSTSSPGPNPVATRVIRGEADTGKPLLTLTPPLLGSRVSTLGGPTTDGGRESVTLPRLFSDRMPGVSDEPATPPPIQGGVRLRVR